MAQAELVYTEFAGSPSEIADQDRLAAVTQLGFDMIYLTMMQDQGGEK